MVNQGVPGPGVAVQLSPHQIGTNLGPAALSPIDQQQLIQSATFDSQLAALQQNQSQQPVAFQNVSGQLMIQNPPQQLVLQSPNQQFALQSPSQQFTIQNQSQFTNHSPNVTHIPPQQQVIHQGQGGNVILQGQNAGMIVQGENFIQGGVNPSMFLHSPIIQHVSPQMYGSTQNLLNTPIHGMFSQSQMLTSQNVGLISVNQSPTGKQFVENMDKTEPSGQGAGIVNQQMQLLAQIAQQTSPNGSNQAVVTTVMKPAQHTVNVVNQAQPQAVNNSSVNQNQSLPSFGHFLLHHHMQSLPHPFLQNLHISSLAPTHTGMPVDVDGSQRPAAKLSVPASNSASTFNAEFNSWNKGQVQGRARKNSSPARSIAPNLVSKTLVTVHSSTVTQVQTSLCDSKTSVTLTSSSCSSNKPDSAMQRTSVTLPVKSSPQLVQNKSTVKQEQSSTASCSLKSDTLPKSILVPYGWVRALEGDSIVYYR